MSNQNFLPSTSYVEQNWLQYISFRISFFYSCKVAIIKLDVTETWLKCQLSSVQTQHDYWQKQPVTTALICNINKLCNRKSRAALKKWPTQSSKDRLKTNKIIFICSYLFLFLTASIFLQANDCLCCTNVYLFKSHSLIMTAHCAGNKILNISEQEAQNEFWPHQQAALSFWEKAQSTHFYLIFVILFSDIISQTVNIFFFCASYILSSAGNPSRCLTQKLSHSEHERLSQWRVQLSRRWMWLCCWPMHAT